MLSREIGDYHFVADAKTGMTLRWGKTLDENPKFAPVPELADISISNHCSKRCSFCYRNSGPNEQFMKLEDYIRVLESMKHPKYGNVFQIAIGGGEPLEHPDFLRFIFETCKRGIIPNFTTNGLLLNPEICKKIKGNVGAVALSITSINDILTEKVFMLRNESIRVNIHYVLSEENVDEATSIVLGKQTEKLAGINAIIFLTYKPAGRGLDQYVIKAGEKLNRFIMAINEKNSCFPRIGFDACFVPMLIRYTSVQPEMVDCCEGGYFSVYIDNEMNVSPCSFSGGRDSYNLKEYDFYDIWLNKFETFRQEHANHCKATTCRAYKLCRGCCPYYPQITTCYVC